MNSLMKRTLPSPKAKFAPPGCRLLKPQQRYQFDPAPLSSRHGANRLGHLLVGDAHCRPEAAGLGLGVKDVRALMGRIEVVLGPDARYEQVEERLRDQALESRWETLMKVRQAAAATSVGVLATVVVPTSAATHRFRLVVLPPSTSTISSICFRGNRSRRRIASAIRCAAEWRSRCRNSSASTRPPAA